MGGAALSDAEELVKCRRKKVEIYQICDLPDMDPAIISDNDMDIRIEVNDEIHWPGDSKNCPSGSFSDGGGWGCAIADDLLINRCYELPNPQKTTIDQPKELEIKIIDVDIFFDETITFRADPSVWYDSMVCDEFQFELVYTKPINGVYYNSKVKVIVTSEVLEENWNI